MSATPQDIANSYRPDVVYKLTYRNRSTTPKLITVWEKGRKLAQQTIGPLSSYQYIASAPGIVPYVGVELGDPDGVIVDPISLPDDDWGFTPIDDDGEVVWRTLPDAPIAGPTPVTATLAPAKKSVPPAYPVVATSPDRPASPA